MDFKTRLAMFVLALQTLHNDHYAQNYPILTAPRIEVMPGRKYVRIVVQQMKDDGTKQEYGRSVYCFVDVATGDIYKAAGWAAPAKHARGSIWNDNCDVGTKCNVFGGGLYLR
jgi:hypothetical protein